MRDNDPNRRAAGEPSEPVPGGPGIPVDDDDDILDGTFVDDGGTQEAVEGGVGASGDEFDDMSLDELDDAMGAPVESGSVDVDVDVDDEAPPRVLSLVNSEASAVMDLPAEPDAPKVPAKRTTGAQLRHDLRTPFNQIIGYSEMLIEDAEASGNEFVVNNIGTVLHDAQQLLALIDEILDPHAQRPSQERLNRDLLFPLSHLLSHVERLLHTSQQRADDEITGDIERILEAVRRLDEIVSSGAVNRVISAVRPTPGEAAQAVREAAGAPKRPMAPHADIGKLLVVDDNESNRNMLSRRLVRQGHTVKLAENGKQALEMLRAEDFDLVLLDVMMPEMDGYQVLEHLHADDKLRGLPVIMISALDQLDTVVKSIELGAEDYLPKPFNPTVLRARIGACLEKKRLRDRERAYIKKLRSEQERSEQLLLNILPRPIASGSRRAADHRRRVPRRDGAVRRLVGFTRMSEQLPPAELVAMLNKIFSMFDQLAEKHGLEKIKTIGDEYMAASGLPMPRPDHARRWPRWRWTCWR
jgi:adenylate cyclase